MKRRADRDNIQSEVYDLAIIGGGITGAGIFREATKKGYKCLLLEKGDFASGTSSKSAKLIHGGMRYLRYGKFGLVRESLAERRYLLKTYPHLVKPIPFLFPIYNSKYTYKIGMAIYQFLSKDNDLPDYRSLSPEDTLKLYPFINPHELKGSFLYYDAVTNDARLCNEVIHTTAQRSNSRALNYCEFLHCIKQGNLLEIECADRVEHNENTFRAKYLINASGVWIDQVADRLRPGSEKIAAPSKGIHIILSREKIPVDMAIVIPSALDKRLLYAVPWENNSVIIGTTDTDYKNDLDNITLDNSDIDYLIKAVQAFAPDLDIKKEDIISTYAGLRPLIAEENTSSKDRSRDYQIWWSDDHILNIFGGKLTSFHSMAKHLLKEVEEKYEDKKTGNHSTEKASPLPAKIPLEIKELLAAKYPDPNHPIWPIVEDTEMQKRLHPRFELILGELVYFTRFQQCYHLDDLLTRRFSLTYMLKDCEDYKSIVGQVAGIMQAECGWSDEELKQEIKRYLELLNKAQPAS